MSVYINHHLLEYLVYPSSLLLVKVFLATKESWTLISITFSIVVYKSENYGYLFNFIIDEDKCS